MKRTLVIITLTLETERQKTTWRQKMTKKRNENSANFLISIYHQENFSYQGEIQWLDTGKKIRFRSELELMNLIHEAAKSSLKSDSEIRTWTDDQKISAV